MPLLNSGTKNQRPFQLDANPRRRPGQFLRDENLRKTFTYVIVWALLTGIGLTFFTNSFHLERAWQFRDLIDWLTTSRARTIAVR